MNTQFEPNSISVSFSSNPRYLTLIRCLVTNTAHIMSFSEEVCQDITLAVDEAITNVIKHCYKSCPEKEIVIKLCMYDDRLEIKIRDFGPKTDPCSIQHRNLNDIRPGGLGVFFIKKIMDFVHYDVSQETGTLLTLIKYKNKTADTTHSGG